MARASWTGKIGFGLVSIDVGTFPVVSEQKVSFNRFHEVDPTPEQYGKGVKGPILNPVGNKNYDKVTGEDLAFADVVSCYTASNGAVVPVDTDEISALKPAGEKFVEIEGFVDADEVLRDTLRFAKDEYAQPKKGSEKAYQLLVSALEQTGKVGIARRVQRGAEKVLVVRPVDGVLVLTTLYWADEVRSVNEVDAPTVELKEAEVNMAIALVDTLSTKWEPTALEDQYRAKVLAMLEDKAQGVVPELPTATEASAPTDLMAALAASVEAAGKGSKA